MSITKTNSSRSHFATSEYHVWGLGEVGRENKANNTPRVQFFRSDFGVSIEGALGASRRYAQEEVALRGREIQCYTIIHSFPKEEFDPHNPNDARRGVDLSYELAKRAHPNSKVNVWWHADSEGGNGHTHCEVMNHDESTGKAIQSNKQQPQIAKINDKLMRENGLSVVTPREKAMTQSAFWSRRRSKELKKEIERLEQDNPQPDKDAQKKLQQMQERLRVLEAPTQWEEELQNTLDDVFTNEEFTTEQEFVQHCKDKGIEARLRTNRKGEVTGLSYKFTDSSGETSTRRSTKLGTEYDLSAVREVMNFYEERDNKNVTSSEISREGSDATIAELNNSFELTQYARDEQSTAASIDELNAGFTVTEYDERSAAGTLGQNSYAAGQEQRADCEYDKRVAHRKEQDERDKRTRERAGVAALENQQQQQQQPKQRLTAAQRLANASTKRKANDNSKGYDFSR